MTLLGAGGAATAILVQAAADAAVATDGRTAEEICEETGIREKRDPMEPLNSGIWNM